MSNSKMPRTSPKPTDEWETVVIDRAYVQQFFNDDRKKQCRQLITEALLMGEFDEIHREAKDFMERKADYVNDGVWELFVDECSRRHGGAMTDAAKRQRTPTRASGYGPVQTSSPMASHALSSSASSTWMVSQPPRPTVLPAAGNARPPSSQQLPMLPVDMAFPPGIVSLTQWGQTVITFSKYAKRRMTYNALAALEGERGDVLPWLDDGQGDYRRTAEGPRYVLPSPTNPGKPWEMWLKDVIMAILFIVF